MNASLGFASLGTISCASMAKSWKTSTQLARSSWAKFSRSYRRWCAIITIFPSCLMLMLLSPLPTSRNNRDVLVLESAQRQGLPGQSCRMAPSLTRWVMRCKAWLWWTAMATLQSMTRSKSCPTWWRRRSTFLKSMCPAEVGGKEVSPKSARRMLTWERVGAKIFLLVQNTSWRRRG